MSPPEKVFDRDRMATDIGPLDWRAALDQAALQPESSHVEEAPATVRSVGVGDVPPILVKDEISRVRPRALADEDLEGEPIPLTSRRKKIAEFSWTLSEIPLTLPK